MPVPAQYREIVRNRVIAAAATGVAIGPGTDIPLLIAIWVEGTLRIASQADVSLEEGAVKQVVGAVFSGAAGWLASGLALDVLTMTIPGVNVAANGLVNAFYTYRYLRAVALMFDSASQVDDMLLDSAISVALASLSAMAPHTIARDMWEMGRSFA